MHVFIDEKEGDPSCLYKGATASTHCITHVQPCRIKFRVMPAPIDAPPWLRASCKSRFATLCPDETRGMQTAVLRLTACQGFERCTGRLRSAAAVHPIVAYSCHRGAGGADPEQPFQRASSPASIQGRAQVSGSDRAAPLGDRRHPLSAARQAWRRKRRLLQDPLQTVEARSGSVAIRSHHGLPRA